MKTSLYRPYKRTKTQTKKQQQIIILFYVNTLFNYHPHIISQPQNSINKNMLDNSFIKQIVFNESKPECKRYKKVGIKELQHTTEATQKKKYAVETFSSTTRRLKNLSK